MSEETDPKNPSDDRPENKATMDAPQEEFIDDQSATDGSPPADEDEE